MPGQTNRGAARLAEKALTGTWRDKDGNSTTLSKWQACLILATSAAPSADTNIISELTEPTGNGYGRVDVPISASGWTAFTEDDTNDKGIATLSAALHDRQVQLDLITPAGSADQAASDAAGEAARTAAVAARSKNDDDV